MQKRWPHMKKDWPSRRVIRISKNLLSACGRLQNSELSLEVKMKFTGLLLLTLILAATVCAQRPRPVEKSEPTNAAQAVPPAAPQTMKAKYEGGIFGYNKTMEGTLSFDDTNQRLLFRKDQKDLFFIPYNAVNSVFSDTQKRRPTAATVAQNVPY